MIESIRALLAEHGRLPVPVEAVADDQDLFKTGLTSFACVQLLLALEDHFDIEFSDESLSRRTFASIETIASNLRAMLVLQPSE